MGIAVALTTTRPRRVLSVTDGCIDREASDLAKYADTYDPAHLVVADTDAQGDPPVWFHVRPVSWDEFTGAAQRCVGESTGVAEELFALACERIEGLQWRDEQGEVQRLNGEAQREVGAGSIRRLQERVILRIPQAIRREIGVVVFQMSKLSEDHAKNS